MKQLEYPYDSDFILRKKKAIKRELLAREGIQYVEKKIAILGGSTTSDIKQILELFLLNYGIKPEFFESEYNKYYEDAVFGNPELDEFAPDLVFVHTTTRNIARFPSVTDSPEQIDALIEETMGRFEQIWGALAERYKCTVIQNNFEQPFFRLLGNSDFTNIHGRLNFINRLNDRFCAYAQSHRNFYINDINYISAVYGIKKWADPGDWYRYKYALSVSAIPDFAFNLAHIIKAVYGRNKKAFALDMDNTLWGGIVGDDGPENIKVGHEDAESERSAIIRKSQEEAEKIVADADKTIENERKRVLRQAQSEIADLAIEAASKIIGENVDDEKNRKLVDKFLSDEEGKK